MPRARLHQMIGMVAKSGPLSANERKGGFAENGGLGGMIFSRQLVGGLVGLGLAGRGDWNCSGRESCG